MNFWNLSDGQQVEQNTSYEAQTNEVIPAKTQCIAAIEEAKWDHYEGDEYITLKWRVAKPDMYANRVVFHKLKVFGTSRDKDPQATADKAKRMLAAIDANAGGKLMQVQGKPTDMQLMSALMGKMMAIRLDVWEIDGKKGNWISAVGPVKQQAGQTQQRQAAPATSQVQQVGRSVEQSGGGTSFDDDIPFAPVSKYLF